MNYYDIKFFHIFMSLLYVYGLMSFASKPKALFSKLIFTLFSVLLIASGITSAARLGFSGTNLPIWIWGKSLLALLLWALPYLLYSKLANKEKLIRSLNFIFVLMALIAVYLGIFKP